MLGCLSIITPVKNAEKWLSACIESALKQDFTDWEWIFVNDHSDDRSAELISAHADRDDRIKLFDNPAMGIIPALQKAFAESTGLYITRMDADDIMPEGRLRKLVSTLKAAPPRSIVTGLVQYFSTSDLSPGYKNYEDWLNGITLQNTHWENVYRECVIASPNWIMRTADLQEIGGFNRVRQGSFTPTFPQNRA